MRANPRGRLLVCTLRPYWPGPRPGGAMSNVPRAAAWTVCLSLWAGVAWAKAPTTRSSETARATKMSRSPTDAADGCPPGPGFIGTAEYNFEDEFDLTPPESTTPGYPG